MTAVETSAARGRLDVRGLWGELRDVEGVPDPAWLEQAGQHAVVAGALDLRVRDDPDGRWAALGLAPLTPGLAERLLPVPHLLRGVERTRALGARLAAELRAGDLLVLTGPLGAGKTALTQGLGAALGVRGSVTSPTFVLARSHRGPLPLVHVDAYRLREAPDPGDALVDLDLELALEDGVVVVEWGEGLVERVADSRLEVRLDRRADADPDTRLVTVRAHGPRWRIAADS